MCIRDSYEAVLLQRGTADSYADFIDASEKDLKQASGVIKPRKVNLTCLLYTSIHHIQNFGNQVCKANIAKNLIFTCAKSVSYTHLDVYKRQA